jgi:RecB family endonuclease NucS
MSDEEKLTAIIGIRVYPSWKEEAKRVAKERGMSLSEFFYECIEAGWDKIISEEDVKQNRG